MRWLVLVLLVPLLACESRVIVTRTPSPRSGGPSATASGAAASPSPTPRVTPAKGALLPIPNVMPASRLISYERGGDIGQPSLRFLLTDDGRVITEDAGSDLVQRKLTPSGTATMLLQAIGTGLFERDANFGREPLPGTTPPAHGATVLVFFVANGTREVRVSAVPTGQPDDELYQRSATREKLTALARGYEDLSWVASSQWAESRPQPFQPGFHRLFVHVEPNAIPPGGPPDAEALWPFLTAIETVGVPVVGVTGVTQRCAVLVDSDARTLGEALALAGAITRYGWGSRAAHADLAWRGGGTLRLQITPLLPHEPVTCAGAAPPL